MAELLSVLRERFAEPFVNLTMAQRATIILVFVMAFVLLGGVINWAVKPDYALLMTELEPSDAQAVIDQLEAENISYKITQGGRGLMIPRKELYEARMKLASNGLPANSTGFGYELFDKNDIGVSEFVQQLNYRRAIEGELCRTIQSMEEVEKARVHLVFPKERVFKEDQEDPSASIFLLLKGRARLSEEHIRGIAQLVAGSVEGLDNENVTIVDDKGNILTKNRKSDSIAALNESQLQLQSQLESYLEDKAQTMLDQFLGQGNSIVRATAELDFRRIEKTNEIYDPENTVVLSEETETQTASDSANYGENNVEHIVTNYQLAKSVEHIIEDIGSIKRLSVAVTLNDRQVKTTNEDGETVIEYSPRTPEEISQIETLTRNAIGISEDRGDQLVVHNLAFEGQTWLTLEELNKQITFWEKWGDLIQKAATVLLLIVGFIIFRARMNKGRREIFGDTTHQLEGGDYDSEMAGSLEAPEEDDIDFLEEIEKATAGPLQRNEDISNYIVNNPSMTAQLIRAWLSEG